MALIGKTKIELTDVKTGKLETFEDSNMLTNALHHFFNDDPQLLQYYPLAHSNGVNYTASYGYYAGFFLPLYKKMIGGILLFADSLPEDAEQVYAPADARCIGYASVDSYSGTNTYRGSWNETESGALEDGTGYKFVWDFSTAQANGTIACASLTTPYGGRFGYGMSLDTQHREVCVTATDATLGPDNTDSNWYKIGPFWGNFYGADLNTPNWFLGQHNQIQNDDVGYTLSLGTDCATLGITVYDISRNKVSLLKTPFTRSEQVKKNVPLSIFKEHALDICISLSDKTESTALSRINDRRTYYASYSNVDFEDSDTVNGAVYVYAFKLDTARNTAAAPTYQTMYIAKVSLDTYEVLYEKEIVLNNFIASTPLAQNNSDTSGTGLNCATFRDNYMYVLQANRTLNNITGDGYAIMKVNLNNQTDQTIIVLPKYANNTWNMNANIVSEPSGRIHTVEGRIVCPTGHIIDSNDNVLFYPMLSVSDSISNTNVSPVMNRSWVTLNRNGKMFKRMSVAKSTSAGYYTWAFYTPCLFTINNLDKPVVKTADKTMKITYILREE